MTIYTAWAIYHVCLLAVHTFVFSLVYERTESLWSLLVFLGLVLFSYRTRAVFVQPDKHNPEDE